MFPLVARLDHGREVPDAPLYNIYDRLSKIGETVLSDRGLDSLCGLILKPLVLFDANKF